MSSEAPPIRPRWRLAALAAFGAAAVLTATQLWRQGSGPDPAAPAAAVPPAAPHAGASPPGARGDASAGHPAGGPDIAAMTARLEARLARDGGDAEGWAMLARTRAVGGDHAAAVPAFRKAAALRPGDPVLLADFADSLAMSQERRLGGEPMELVRRALQLDPRNAKALSLAGSEAFERQDYRAAVDHWERLLAAAAGADDPLVRQVQGALAEARARLAAGGR